MTEKKDRSTLFIENYLELSKKYDLPLLDDLNYEFELVDIIIEKNIAPSFPLRYIRRIIVGVFYGWINYLHNFLMPNQQSAILIHEAKYFTTEQKEQVTSIINKIMIINRISTKLDLEHSEEKDAEFIQKYFTEWSNIKRFILDCAKINIESWEKEIPPEKHEFYFG